MKKKILLAFVLAVCTSCAAFAADVALTSIGQGPDAMMIKVIMRSLKITPDYEPLMKPEALNSQKALVAAAARRDWARPASTRSRKSCAPRRCLTRRPPRA